MKKMNNKGFSLVELIIVIAIMAILAGALAPALIKYIAKSRRSSDASNCGTIQSAMQTATSDEVAGEAMPTGDGSWYDLSAVTPASDSYWSVVDADLSGGIAAFKNGKTNKLAKKDGSTDKVSGVKYYYMISAAGDVHVGISEGAGKRVYECVPNLSEYMGGKDTTNSGNAAN